MILFFFFSDAETIWGRRWTSQFLLKWSTRPTIRACRTNQVSATRMWCGNTTDRPLQHTNKHGKELVFDDFVQKKTAKPRQRFPLFFKNCSWISFSLVGEEVSAWIPCLDPLHFLGWKTHQSSNHRHKLFLKGETKRSERWRKKSKPHHELGKKETRNLPADQDSRGTSAACCGGICLHPCPGPCCLSARLSCLSRSCEPLLSMSATRKRRKLEIVSS